MTTRPATPVAVVRRPEAILDLTPEDADEFLGVLEATVPVGPGAIEVPSERSGEALVVGDVHGDWRSLEPIVGEFERNSGNSWFISLGDFVDRPPTDCPNGSVATALYLLGLKSRYPDRVLLLKGNHEATRTIPVVPHDLPEEVDSLWGPDEERYGRLLALIERGSWAARSASGVYLAHAGFPSPWPHGAWADLYAEPSQELLLDTLWRDASESRFDRGLSRPFTDADLALHLAATGTRVFLRGHDADLTGRPIFHDRCLTLHTTRVYESYGGVIYARFPLDRSVTTVHDLRVEHVPTEGQSFEVD